MKAISEIPPECLYWCEFRASRRWLKVCLRRTSRRIRKMTEDTSANLRCVAYVLWLMSGSVKVGSPDQRFYGFRCEQSPANLSSRPTVGGLNAKGVPDDLESA